MVMTRIELFESMGFELSGEVSIAEFRDNTSKLIPRYSFKRKFRSTEDSLFFYACTSWHDKTSWYTLETYYPGSRNQSSNSSKIDFEEVFDILTLEQQEIAIWNLDLLR